MSGQATGYKSHDPARQATSQTYQWGHADGVADRERADKGWEQVGPDMDYARGWMYSQGYIDGFNGR